MPRTRSGGNRGYMRSARSGCGCNTPTINKVRMVQPPPCGQEVRTRTWPYLLQEYQTVTLSQTPTSTTLDLPNKVTNAYILEFSAVNASGNQIQVQDVIDALPFMWISDGGRTITPSNWTKQDWANFLNDMGVELRVEQAQKPSIGSIVKCDIPLPMGIKYQKGSVSGCIDTQCAFTPHTKPILHLEDPGDTSNLTNRQFVIDCVFSLNRPQYERVIDNKVTTSLSGVGFNCIRLPTDGCLEMLILEPKTTYSDGVTKDGAVTLKSWQFEQNGKAIMNVDGQQHLDFVEFMDTEKVPNDHWLPLKFHNDEQCCSSGCLGLDCNTQLKVECGVDGGSTLSYTCVRLIPAYQGCPCCC